MVPSAVGSGPLRGGPDTRWRVRRALPVAAIDLIRRAERAAGRRPAAVE